MLAKEVVSGGRRTGWLHYRWPRPGHDRPGWMSCYLQRVPAPMVGDYIVMSGIFPATSIANS